MLNLRPRLLCETGGETCCSESLGLSMQRPKRTVSSLNAQTFRLAGLGLTVQLSSSHMPSPDCMRETKRIVFCLKSAHNQVVSGVTRGGTLYFSALQYWLPPEAVSAARFFIARVVKLPPGESALRLLPASG
jgi:hypothetical protein